MASHYLFFKPNDSVNLIDVMRPRARQGVKRPPFNFQMRFEERYGELAFYVMNDAQVQRIRGKSREAEEKRPPIYAINDMVTAELVDFTSIKLEPSIRTFRADFFSPVQKKQFAYATTYGSGKFAEKMMKDKGLKLEMLKFQDYNAGQPISEAVKGVFSTYELALFSNQRFLKYQGRSLALVVSGKLIERE